MSARYATDIIVTVEELEESYCKQGFDGFGYGRLPEYKLVCQLIKRAELLRIILTA